MTDLKQIDALVFDYGGVIVNLDSKQVTSALCSLGLSRLKQFLHRKEIMSLIRDFIDGLIPTSVTLEKMQHLCSKDTTVEEILVVLNKLCGDLPTSRLQALCELRKHYKVYMLSNISDVLWDMSAKEIRAAGFEPSDCFDGLYLSYEMGAAKPNADIYNQIIKKAGLIPERTIYFEDREDNCAAGRAMGFNTVQVKTNYLEQTEEWQALMTIIK